MIEEDLRNAEDKSEQIIKHIEGITNATSRISKIISSLKSLTISDQAKRSELDLEELCLGKVEILKPIYLNKGISLKFFSSLKKKIICGNSANFQQILLQLLSNANDAFRTFP